MSTHRPIHPDFQFFLDFKSQELMDLFRDLREYLLGLFPGSNELLYHTHALTSVFSVTDKLSGAFCMIPVYTSHLNLGFNKGTLLNDPHGLLTGTGTLIRHIGVATPGDYRQPRVAALLEEAHAFAIRETAKPTRISAATISKIRK